MTAPWASVADLRREAEICRIKARAFEFGPTFPTQPQMDAISAAVLVHTAEAKALDAAADALVEEAQDG